MNEVLNERENEKSAREISVIEGPREEGTERAGVERPK